VGFTADFTDIWIVKSKVNVTTFLGMFVAGVVVYKGVISGAVRKDIFLDSHALILVLGGTLAAALIAYPRRQFADLFSFITQGALVPSEKNTVKVAEQILLLSYRPELAKVDPHLRNKFHPFLLEGYALMESQEWTGAEYRMILQSRIRSYKERYGLDAKALTALAKYPPAFGLLGATAGMIAMMSNLGPSGRDSIGPAMAVALVATFWGIAIANFVLLPLADHVNRLNAEDAKIRLMIATGLSLIQQGTRPSALFEHLISFAPPYERTDERLKAACSMAEYRLAQSQKQLEKSA
jgi:chemotaxis protein MotA